MMIDDDDDVMLSNDDECDTSFILFYFFQVYSNFHTGSIIPTLRTFYPPIDLLSTTTTHTLVGGPSLYISGVPV